MQRARPVDSTAHIIPVTVSFIGEGGLQLLQTLENLRSYSLLEERLVYFRGKS